MVKRNWNASSGSGARSNPGRVRTGISRSVLLSLEEGPASIALVLDRLGDRSRGVTHGTIWTTLERARAQGLVTCGVKKAVRPPYIYSLTDGGMRRVEWIKEKLSRMDEKEE